jgi:hypothetical protein
MSNFLRTYGTTLGPVGIPMSDSQAYALDAILKQLPESDRQVRKATLAPALTAIEPGERADISWISTEAVDRDREIVLARGMRDDHFNLNPLVTLGHCYSMPPVGKSVWRKAADHPSGHKGILAKTLYPSRPESWAANGPWEPDDALALIQAGLLNGKSIGFIPSKPPRYLTDDERAKNPAVDGAQLVINKWPVLDYPK